MKLFALAAIVTVATGLGTSAQQVYKPGDKGVTAPVVVAEKRPSYTAAAMRAKISGTVVMEAVITADGRPTDIRVVTSLEPGLDKNAIAALNEWRFKPATREGKPVPVAVTIEMTFTLRDGPVFDKTHVTVKPPVLVADKLPSYTPEAMRAGIEGAVEVEGTVGADGKISDVRVVKSLAPDLDAKALEAFKAATFKPAMHEGRAVAYRVTMLFTFTLRN